MFTIISAVKTDVTKVNIFDNINYQANIIFLSTEQKTGIQSTMLLESIKMSTTVCL